MKSFGFPGSSSNNTPYRADTSAKKGELINILTRSEKLWNEEKYEESTLCVIAGLVQLRKAISILEFIIPNESIESVKEAYTDKLKELKQRLKNREENKEPVQSKPKLIQHIPVEEATKTEEVEEGIKMRAMPSRLRSPKPSSPRNPM